MNSDCSGFLKPFGSNCFSAWKVECILFHAMLSFALGSLAALLKEEPTDRRSVPTIVEMMQVRKLLLILIL